jgi:hypothetical protein
MDKKAQLIQLEFHFLWIGALIGIVLILVLVGLSQNGILPFTIPGTDFLCPIAGK